MRFKILPKVLVSSVLVAFRMATFWLHCGRLGRVLHTFWSRLATFCLHVRWLGQVSGLCLVAVGCV